MKKLIIFLLLALSVSANAQNKKAQFLYFLSQQAGTPSGGSGYGSGINIQVVSGLDTTRQNILRHNVEREFTINVPTDYYAAWTIREFTTQTAVASGTGLSGAFTPSFTQEDISGFGALPTFVKEYSLEVSIHKDGNYFMRTFNKNIKVYPQKFNEAGATTVWDYGSSTSYKDGGGIDRAGQKFFIKGSHTGAGYIAFEQYRSSDPKNPVVFQFSDVAQVTINTSSAYLIQANFDCQNLIIDGSANDSEEYGFSGTFTSAGSQGVRIQPADPTAGSTLLTAGYNIAISGIEIDGNRSGGSAFNVNFDSVTGSVIEYDTWTFSGFFMSNCRGYDTTDEYIYLGRFNDQLVSGYAKPSITGASVSWNIGDTSGGDGLQFGILFDSDISNNTGINLNWRNATSHRNLFQLVGCRNTYFYQNKLQGNESEGGSTLWNIETGRGGADFYVFSNVLVNRFTGSHANGVTIIDENEVDDVIAGSAITHNTIILNIENSLEVWRRDGSVVTDLNPFYIANNAVLNINDPDLVVYINTPDQSGYTVANNMFSQTTTDFDFANYAGNNFRPVGLDAGLWGANTSVTIDHPCANMDVDGYTYVDAIRGAYSGVPLIIQGIVPDITAPTISDFTIPDANPDRIYFESSEIITASTVTGFTAASPSNTITGVTINAGQLTGHYFTVTDDFEYGDSPTLAYTSGSNFIDASSNALAGFSATAITNDILAPVSPTNVKINFFTGTATGWIATGATSPKPGTDSPVDFGQLGSTGVGLRSLNVDATHRWNATGSGGTTTGSNSGVYPDNVLQTYWYIDGVNIAGFELYDHTGTPLTGRTFTITLLGNRTVGSARYMNARVNGGAWSADLDVNNNTTNVLTFTGVTVSSGKILVEIRATAGAGSFAYINGLTLDSE